MSLMMMIILEIVMELALNQVELRVALICYLAIENHHNMQKLFNLGYFQSFRFTTDKGNQNHARTLSCSILLLQIQQECSPRGWIGSIQSRGHDAVYPQHVKHNWSWPPYPLHWIWIIEAALWPNSPYPWSKNQKNSLKDWSSS